ncbi:MAG: CHAT domain-containing protein [Pseudomonadales bacterium]|nr:CHAT domain-containing protein [Pseudomonadales bacterium]
MSPSPAIVHRKYRTLNPGALLLVALGLALCSYTSHATTDNPGQIRPQLVNQQLFEKQLQHAAQLIEKGSTHLAIESLDKTLSHARKMGDIQSQINTLGLLSDAYLLAGHPQDALENANKTVALATRHQVAANQAVALNYQGNAYVALRDLQGAKRSFQEALSFAKAARNDQLIVSIIINHLHTLTALNEHLDTYDQLQTGFSIANGTSNQDQVTNLITLSHLSLRVLNSKKLSNDKQANRLLKNTFTALTKAKNLTNINASKTEAGIATGLLGELYSYQGRQSEAEKLYQQALFVAHETKNHYLASRWYWRLGQLQAQSNNKEAAINSYYHSLASLSGFQPALITGWRGLPGTFQESMGIVYLELAQLLLEKAEVSTTASARQIALKGIRDIMEQYRTVELKEYFRDACVSNQLDQQPDIDIDHLITPGTAVLYPVVLKDRLLLLLSLADNSISYREVLVDSDELERNAQQFRALMNPSSNPRSLMKISMRLYDQLIRPVAAQLQQSRVENLVIVPDNVLRTIPFAALHNGQSYLVNEYALAIAPGLTLTDVANSGESTEQIFAGGLSEGVQGFPRLNFVKPEVESISALDTGKKLLDSQFVKSNVISELSQTNYKWVTFSTHAQINQNFNESYLLTYDDKLSFNELENVFQSAKLRNKNVELLVLSACETAVGDQRAALGLAGLAVKAGVKSAMASLWKVNDKYTSELIPQFLTNLKNTELTKAQALQTAQLDLINKHNITHPYYWAAFVVVGNWL